MVAYSLFVIIVLVAWAVSQLPRSLYRSLYPKSVRPCKGLVTCGKSMYIQSSRLRGRLLHYVKFFVLCISGGHASD